MNMGECMPSALCPHPSPLTATQLLTQTHNPPGMESETLIGVKLWIENGREFVGVAARCYV